MNDLIGEVLGLCLFLFCFLVCVGCVAYGIWRITTGQCQEAYIDEILYDGSRRGRIYVFRIQVKTFINNTETKLLTSEIFTSSWVYKRKWERLKQKYIGKKVHIYMNPKQPNSQVITRELCWRMFLPIGLAAMFLGVILFFLGIDLINDIVKLI